VRNLSSTQPPHSTLTSRKRAMIGSTVVGFKFDLLAVSRAP
jgi:hypothetical protein